jgi:hypothetical protein
MCAGAMAAWAPGKPMRSSRLGPARLSAAVNAIVPGAPPSGSLDLLVMLPEALLVSRDTGQTWVNWKDNLELPATISSIAAPAGLGQGMPLLLGLANGQKLRL